MPSRTPPRHMNRKPPPKQARSAAKRAAILDAAEALLATTAPSDLTTRLIAEAADIPIGSVYRYFTNVDDVLMSLFERINSGTVLTLQSEITSESPDWRGHLDRTFDHLTAMHASHPAYGANMAHIDVDARDNNEISDLLGTLLRRNLPTLDPTLIDMITTTVIAMLDGVEQRLDRLPEIERPRLLAQARIAIAAYLAHYLDQPG